MTVRGKINELFCLYITPQICAVFAVKVPSAMASHEYHEIDEYEKVHNEYQRKKSRTSPKSILCNLAIAVVCFALGFGLRDSKESMRSGSDYHHEHGPRPPQSFIPKSRP